MKDQNEMIEWIIETSINEDCTMTEWSSDGVTFIPIPFEMSTSESTSSMDELKEHLKYVLEDLKIETIEELYSIMKKYREEENFPELNKIADVVMESIY